MFYVINWFVVLSLLALWSLAAWALHAVVAWTVSSSGVLAGASGAATGLQIPDWLAPWVTPGIAEALTSLGSVFMPAIEAVLAWAPALAGGLSVAVWVVWGIVSALLIVLGVVLSGMIAVLSRRSSTPRTPSSGQPAAG